MTNQYIQVTTDDFQGNITTHQERVYTIQRIADELNVMPGAVLSKLIDFGNENVEDHDTEDWVTALSDLGYLIDDESHRISDWTFTQDTIDILA